MLGFDYDDSLAWFDDLGASPDLATYDLCGEHAGRFNPPVGWTFEDRRMLGPLGVSDAGHQDRSRGASEPSQLAEAAAGADVPGDESLAVDDARAAVTSGAGGPPIVGPGRTETLEPHEGQHSLDL